MFKHNFELEGMLMWNNERFENGIQNSDVDIFGTGSSNKKGDFIYNYPYPIYIYALIYEADVPQFQPLPPLNLSCLYT